MVGVIFEFSNNRIANNIFRSDQNIFLTLSRGSWNRWRFHMGRCSRFLILRVIAR